MRRLIITAALAAVLAAPATAQHLSLFALCTESGHDQAGNPLILTVTDRQNGSYKHFCITSDREQAGVLIIKTATGALVVHTTYQKAWSVWERLKVGDESALTEYR